LSRNERRREKQRRIEEDELAAKTKETASDNTVTIQAEPEPKRKPMFM
jgi:hypothetical protein